MKKLTLFFSLFIVAFGFTQSPPINFEGDITAADFFDIDRGTAIVTVNPLALGISTSATVAQIIRDGGGAFSSRKILLVDNLDFSSLTKLSMKVYTTAPVETTVKFKLEGSAPFADVNATTTVSGAWVTSTWDLSNGDNGIYNVLTLMLSYATPDDASANATFLFDDIEQKASLSDGIDQSLSIKDVMTYPNPTKDLVTISSKNKSIKSITLYNTIGKQVLELQPNSREITINSANFKSGINIAKIFTETDTGSLKILKE